MWAWTLGEPLGTRVDPRESLSIPDQQVAAGLYFLLPLSESLGTSLPLISQWYPTDSRGAFFFCKAGRGFTPFYTSLPGNLNSIFSLSQQKLPSISTAHKEGHWWRFLCPNTMQTPGGHWQWRQVKAALALWGKDHLNPSIFCTAEYTA